MLRARARAGAAAAGLQAAASRPAQYQRRRRRHQHQRHRHRHPLLCSHGLPPLAGEQQKRWKRQAGCRQSVLLQLEMPRLLRAKQLPLELWIQQTLQLQEQPLYRQARSPLQQLRE